ncbi:MAG: hypothetical protein P1U56_22360 [Saprospiraceae bacterium]|nr:hypothetical protein [Saprospiraceae bacterium]
MSLCLTGFLSFIGIITSVNAQFVEWVFLPENTETGSCISTSNYENQQICYGLQYTPSSTGTMTSYTMGFFVNCPLGSFSNLSASSCTLADNTDIIDACETNNLSLLIASGNNTTYELIENQPVILHQICMEFNVLDSVPIVIDQTTGITISISTNDGPITDSPPFDGFTADYTGFGIYPCEEGQNCSLDFGLGGLIEVDTNANGKIVVGDTLANGDLHSQAFDVYDELNKLCGIYGGEDDIRMNWGAIHTYDVNGNGIANKYVGNSLNISQDSIGFSGVVPFGNSIEDESSSGDVRGYEMEVLFEDHLTITAEQLTVVLKDVAQANGVFESVSVIFYGQEGYKYGKYSYNGALGGMADLSGGCGSTPLTNPFQKVGKGIVTIYDTNSINLFNPCSPIAGTSSNDTVYVNAAVEGGLGSGNKITGFKVVVLGEDVAAPNMLDDGSNQSGEDAIVGNRPTSTNVTMISSILGYKIDGCVFEEPERDLLQINITSDKPFAAIGDQVTYQVEVVNGGVIPLTDIDLEVVLPDELINVSLPSGASLINGTVFIADQSIDGFDTLNYTISGNIDPTSLTTEQIIDIVEGSSPFSDFSCHPEFDAWFVSNSYPRSGINHWKSNSDTCLNIEYLRIDDVFVPTVSTILTFYHSYDFQENHDGGQIEVSTDEGKSWQSLGSQFISGGYNGYINEDSSDEAFSGENLNYTESTISLAEFADQPIWLRFSSFSDYLDAEDGWYIDDILINEVRTPLPCIAIARVEDQVLRDSIFLVTSLVECTDVYETTNAGQGSLRRSIACASIVDTIKFMPNIDNQTIVLTENIGINKNLLIQPENINVTIDQTSDEPVFTIANFGFLKLRNLSLKHSGQISSASLLNNGTMTLKDARILNNLGLYIQNNGVLSVQNDVYLQVDD